MIFEVKTVNVSMEAFRALVGAPPDAVAINVVQCGLINAVVTWREPVKVVAQVEEAKPALFEEPDEPEPPPKKRRKRKAATENE